jgi:hypothetical protein
MVVDLKRVDAMEEDQEATSRLQPGALFEEFPSSSIPDSVIPSNARFLSYDNLKKSVAFLPVARKHPWMSGALAVMGKLHREIINLKQQVNKLEEENHILKGIIIKNIGPSSPKKET